ncbi:Domain of uncharacterised function (DUF2825) [Salmonella enterica]|nr:Domain of uncharacterised function (DUF2825) [Salmonella enterica]
MLPSKRRLFGLSPLARGTHSKARKANLRQRFIPAGAGNTDADHQSGGYQPVYPRWRGEHLILSNSGQDRNGLSPLARGTQSLRGYLAETARFIPAGAGNTANLSNKISLFAVYPRWRGEHVSAKEAELFCGGLSPLARGTRPRGLSFRTIFRFIPAGAGNTGRY